VVRVAEWYALRRKIQRNRQPRPESYQRDHMAMSVLDRRHEARRSLGAAVGAPTLVASLGTAGPIADSVRTIGLIVVGVVGAAVVFVAVVFANGLLEEPKLPYPM
jgi:hypothetical protein